MPKKKGKKKKIRYMKQTFQEGERIVTSGGVTTVYQGPYTTTP